MRGCIATQRRMDSTVTAPNVNGSPTAHQLPLDEARLSL